jgi:transposase
MTAGLQANDTQAGALLIQLAWLWLRYQPQSKHSRWFQERFGGGSKRQRRIGIVALARRLVIDLWRFSASGVVPEGTRLKVA